MFISAVPHFRENTSSVSSARASVTCFREAVIAGENTPVTIPFVALELRRGVVSVDNWTNRSNCLFPSVATDYVQNCTIVVASRAIQLLRGQLQRKIGFSANLDKFKLAPAGVC